MIPITESAPAKVNLTLKVAGRRPDGRHELLSLITFASLGDRVTLVPGREAAISVDGPFAAALMGDNILERTLARLSAEAPHLRLGAVHLDKQLPVAAGLGGGSADAAALLRAVRRANGASAAGVDWSALAASLGADVPVCLEARALWVAGAGETLTEIGCGVPRLDVVLVNPLAAVPVDKTARVFAARGARPLDPSYARPQPPRVSNRDALLALMRAEGNDLAHAAAAVVPETDSVLAALRAIGQAEHVAVSGAGPTCFAVFPEASAAVAVRAKIAADHPEWWVAAASLG